MHNLGTLYRYELKKLLQRKIVLISLPLLFLFILFTLLSALMGNFYVNGEVYASHGELYFQNRDYERALTGRKIDQALLEEMVQSYRRVEAASSIYGDGSLPTDAERIELNELYYTYAAPYKTVYNFARNATTLTSDDIYTTWQVDEENFYERHLAKVRQYWEEYRLTKEEISFLEEQEKALEKPFTFACISGFRILFDSLYSIGFFLLFFTMITLSGLFPAEHSLRTDQLILSAREGKGTLYFAKLLAGISFSAGTTLFALILSFAAAFGIYGTDGFHAAIQLLYPFYSRPLTAGWAVLIGYGIMILTVILVSLCVMLLSELFKNSTATLAVTSGLLILGMILEIPDQYRLLAQAWSYLPNCFLAVWNIFNDRPVSLFGQHFAPWQFVPPVYLVLGILLAAAGKSLYNRYQVSGR